ncbi:hypothetical protein CFOL_v3_24752, partial [Cephalotus follicularis]
RKGIYLIGSLNGIICLSFYYYKDMSGTKIALWNPATNEIKVHPEFGVGVESYFPFIGFGLDAKTKDYKVVKMYGETCDTTPESRIFQVDVYSLCNNNSWRELDVGPPAYLLPCYPDAPVYTYQGDHFLVRS